MRAWMLLPLLVACGGDVDPTDDTDADVGDSVEVTCASWDEFSCNGVGRGCVAQCLPADKTANTLHIECQTRQCTLTGTGMGAGKSCQVSVGDMQDGCGFCETAFEECR